MMEIPLISDPDFEAKLNAWSADFDERLAKINRSLDVLLHELEAVANQRATA